MAGTPLRGLLVTGPVHYYWRLAIVGSSLMAPNTDSSCIPRHARDSDRYSGARPTAGREAFVKNVWSR